MVVDDQWIRRVAVAAALKADTSLEIVGEVPCGSDVLSLTRSAAPDVVLLGTRIPNQDGLGCLSLLRECHPEVKVVVFSASADLDHVEDVFRLGASGCILSTIAPLELAAAIRRIVEAAEYQASAPFHKSAPAHLSGLEARELN
ncbi:MAG TPA: response regulator transcription factor [Gaiellaceae bacterium]|jgi:DNA-binding NarL/FixJ family response regulator|nr:response regulator transcription factor [Gaiellaceae bacterium]